MALTEPTIAQCKAIIGLLIEEGDALREGMGTANWSYGRRAYSPEQMEHGRKLSPSVSIANDGGGFAKVES